MKKTKAKKITTGKKKSKKWIGIVVALFVVFGLFGGGDDAATEDTTTKDAIVEEVADVEIIKDEIVEETVEEEVEAVEETVEEVVEEAEVISNLMEEQVAEDVTKAIAMLEECALLGKEEAIEKLRFIYSTGYKVIKDKVKALEWQAMLMKG